MKNFKKHILILICVFATSTFAFSSGLTFSGIAGGKLDANSNPDSSSFDPNLTLQAFFSGQFGFSENIWSHLEFSIDSKNLINSSFCHQTESFFQLDELSIIFRAPLDSSSNYFSIFMGTYDPIGSDIFLQRQFNISPITSKLTESWLGMAGSLLYPHFGLGISDVVHFAVPMAAGLYLYLNHEDKDYYILNGDLRFAGSYRFFTFDVAAGLGAPLGQKNTNTDVLFSINKVYWHAGTTILFGNNYTQNLFIQAGLYNGAFSTTESGAIVSAEDLYVLFEPRFRGSKVQFHLSIYGMPKATAEKLLFVHDSLGIDMNFFFDQLSVKTKPFTLGFHATLSFPGKSISDVMAPLALFESFDALNINLTPYIESTVGNGELHALLNANISKIAKSDITHALFLSFGYKARF